MENGSLRGISALLSPTRAAADASGIPFLVVGAFLISIGALCIKLMGPRIPLMEMILTRAIIGIFICLRHLNRHRVPIWGNSRGMLVLRGLTGFSAMTCAFFAITRLPLADATLFFFMHPVFAALLAYPLLGERIQPSAALGILASLIGLGLISHPSLMFTAAPARDTLGVVVALTGAVLAGTTIVIVRRLGQSEYPMVLVFYQALFMLPFSALATAFNFAMPGLLDIGLLVLLGVSLNVGQYYLVLGFSREPAGKASAVGYLQVVFAAVWGALFFHEYPDLTGVAGALLIVAGTLTLNGVGLTTLGRMRLWRMWR